MDKRIVKKNRGMQRPFRTIEQERDALQDQALLLEKIRETIPIEVLSSTDLVLCLP